MSFYATVSLAKTKMCWCLWQISLLVPTRDQINTLKTSNFYFPYCTCFLKCVFFIVILFLCYLLSGLQHHKQLHWAGHLLAMATAKTAVCIFFFLITSPKQIWSRSSQWILYTNFFSLFYYHMYNIPIARFLPLWPFAHCRLWESYRFRNIWLICVGWLFSYWILKALVV